MNERTKTFEVVAAPADGAGDPGEDAVNDGHPPNNLLKRIVATSAIKVDAFRLQTLDPDRVVLFARITERFGRWNPITVTAALDLVGGIYWFAAAQALGLQKVEVFILGDDDARGG